MKEFIVTVLQTKSFDLRVKAETAAAAEKKAKDVVLYTDAFDYKHSADYATLVTAKREEGDSKVLSAYRFG